MLFANNFISQQQLMLLINQDVSVVVVVPVFNSKHAQVMLRISYWPAAITLRYTISENTHYILSGI